MLRWLVIFIPCIIVAFTILFLSVLRTASVKYEFPDNYLVANTDTSTDGVYIEYSLPYPGKVLPDSYLWPIKAIRDNVWLMITTNPERQAELYLHFADKRLGASSVLFENGKPEVGLSTLNKAEQYLGKAMEQEEKNRALGIDTNSFLRRITFASLKHQQLINQIISVAPEQARPEIIEIRNSSISIYDRAASHLINQGMDVPLNPFKR